MSFLAFLASVIGSLAWPAVVIFLLFLLKPHLSGLAARLVELTLPGGAKAKFEKQLDEAREDTEKIAYVEGYSISPVGEVGPTGIEEFIALANLSPESAIMQSYNVLESVPITFRNKIPPQHKGSLGAVIRDLHRRELLDSSWVQLFERIRSLRNLSVHAGAAQRVTPGEALEYQSLCRLLSDKLFEVLGNLPTIDPPIK